MAKEWKRDNEEEEEEEEEERKEQEEKGEGRRGHHTTATQHNLLSPSLSLPPQISFLSSLISFVSFILP